MVSRFPRFFTASQELESHGEPPLVSEDFTPAADAEGFGEKVLDRVREAFCGLHGHDNLLQFERDRMFLKCVSCGHESPGWELNEAPPTPLSIPETNHRPAARPHLVSDRRIA
jgi:hypothetical protein